MAALLKIFKLLLCFFMIKFSFNCNSTKRKKNDNSNILKVNKDDFEEEYKNLRIAVDWTNYDKDIPEDSDKDFIKLIREVVIKQAIELFQKIFKIKRFKNTLKFEGFTKCSDFDISESLQKQGVEADLVIMPLLDKTGEYKKQGTEAAATHCILNSYNNRPIMGYIEYRPTLKAGGQNVIDYHIWLTFHELSHVLAFNDSLFEMYINPTTLEKIPKGDIVRKYNINGFDTNFVVSPKVREIASNHFNCPGAYGVPLENKREDSSHWNRKVMNGDYMIATSFGENLISDISLAFFEDTGWYKPDYSLSNLFIWGKNEGCDFLYMKECYLENKVDLDKNEFKVISKYPREFCSNFNNPVCSTHNYFRGICEVTEKNKEGTDKLKDYVPFSNKSFTGGFIETDYCPIPIEITYEDDYYGGSCRVGQPHNIDAHEKICPTCSCAITNFDKESVNSIVKKHKLRIKMGTSKVDKENKIYFKKSKYLKASCLEFKCQKEDNKKTLYVSILNQSYLCNKRYILIPDVGIIKCPLKRLICHEKYNCKFGCVTRFDENLTEKKKKKMKNKKKRKSKIPGVEYY